MQEWFCSLAQVRAREVAVLQAQMTSERAASEATLHDVNRHSESLCQIESM